MSHEPTKTFLSVKLIQMMTSSNSSAFDFEASYSSGLTIVSMSVMVPFWDHKDQIPLIELYCSKALAALVAI